MAMVKSQEHGASPRLHFSHRRAFSGPQAVVSRLSEIAPKLERFSWQVLATAACRIQEARKHLRTALSASNCQRYPTRAAKRFTGWMTATMAGQTPSPAPNTTEFSHLAASVTRLPVRTLTDIKVNIRRQNPPFPAHCRLSAAGGA